MSRSIIFALFACCLAIVARVPDAWGEQRVALVIGNSGYQSVSPLDNPGSDAKLMAERLEGLGFAVTLLIDADLTSMKKGVVAFGRELRAGGKDTTGLFYYAGHGVQSFGFNYLLPVDAALSDAADLDLVAVEASSVLRQMFSASNRTNIVILDACRDNPFESITSFDDNGLAEMKAPTGTFLAYATAPGNVALDGDSGNSPFTSALAEEMLVAGSPIEQVFKQVRVKVLEQTGGRQTPWDTSSLTQQFYFIEPVVEDPEQVAARQMWEATKSSNDMIEIMLYLRLHPDSPYETEARELLASMVAKIGEDDGSGPATAEAAGAADNAQGGSEEGPTETTPAVSVPVADEETLINVAQASGDLADYEAYLKAYPEGVFAELARIEIDALRRNQSTDPDGGDTAPTVVASTPQPASGGDKAVAPGTAFADVSYLIPIDSPESEIHGRSIEQLAQGRPLFPPIDGLPESYWKGQDCSNCHQWTREALCTQAKTYLADSAGRSLAKQHPYGGGFKQVLKSWAEGDCR